MSEWLKMTPRLETGLKTIDQLDDGKFRALANRVCATLRFGSGAKVFGREEEKKILASLETNEETLKIVVDTIKSIYLQAGYGTVKPSTMETFMKKHFPISEEKVSIFADTWMTHAKGLVEYPKHKYVFPVQVDTVNWELNIRSSSSALSHEANPVVWLQLGLTGPEENSKLTIEIDKNDLTDIYNKFEDIQRQLDQLERAPEKNASS